MLQRQQMPQDEEYEAFAHVLKNGSGAIRRKIEQVFGNTLSNKDKQALATLIYYPKEKMNQIKKNEDNMEDWYKITLYRLIQVCKNTASKYTRSKVRKAMPKDFAYVIEELINEKEEGMNKEDIAEIVALPRTDIALLNSKGLKAGQYVKLKYLNLQ